jgi:hypothetical protein
MYGLIKLQLLGLFRSFIIRTVRQWSMKERTDFSRKMKTAEHNIDIAWNVTDGSSAS